MSAGGGVALLLAGALAATTAWADSAPDPAAAERAYRLGERLSAEGSSEAASAFEQAVALDPRGALADDALVALAKLRGAPEWPEELGEVSFARATQAAAALQHVIDDYGSGDRVLEARYKLALIHMAPIPGRDAVRARHELLALASGPPQERWVVASRYALGVLDEMSGASDRAAGAYARILMERPGSEAAPRASTGFARTLLGEERFGEAAGWLQDAVDRGAPGAVHAEALRTLAVSEVLSERVPARRWTAPETKLRTLTTSRGAVLLAAGAEGVVVFDRKNDTLSRFDDDATPGPVLSLPEVSALATDRYGRVFAAAKDGLMLWGDGGTTVLSALTGFESPAALAVDAEGRVWIADRKGDRIARWSPGADSAVVVRESKGAGVTALVAAGARVIAAEEKTGRLVTIAESGAAMPFGTGAWKRPIALCVDAAGRVTVLDGKAGTLTRLSPFGQVRDTLALGPLGVSRPVALAAGADGTVRVLDSATGAILVTP